MKRFLALTAALALLLPLTACGSDDDHTNSSEESSSSVSSVSPSPSSSEDSGSSTAEITEETQDMPDYQAALDKIVSRYTFDGVVYITQNGNVLARSATGKTDLSGTNDIKDNSLFCIASISKQFAAAAIMILQEQEKISTDDKLSLYFPEYEFAKDVTIKDLLDMRSGIRDYYELDADSDALTDLSEERIPYKVFAESDAYDNRQAIIEWLYNEPLNFEPDTNYSYSNSNYLLLSQIVEKVSGTEYHTFIRDNIFTPLGMENTGFIDDLSDDSRLVQPVSDPGKLYYPGVTAGAADIISCAEDIDKWLTALNKNTLLNEESYNEMTANYSESADGSGYGYGLMINGDGSVMHIGSVSTYLSTAYTDRENEYNLFLVTNNKNAMTGDIDSFITSLTQEIRVR